MILINLTKIGYICIIYFVGIYEKNIFLFFISIVLISLSGCIDGEYPTIYVIGDYNMIVPLGFEWKDLGTMFTYFEGEDLVVVFPMI